MFKFITKFKLARKDKKIIRLLRNSEWYQKNRNKDAYDLALKGFDRDERWIQEIESFIDFILSKKRYKVIIDQTDLERQDLIDIYLLMIIATMPNPVFKTGFTKGSITLIGSSFYQEIQKQLKPLLSTLGVNYSKHDHEKFGHKYASDVMIFASQIKEAHESKYGEVNIDEVM